MASRDAAQTLSELVELSSQIEGAVLTGPDGLVASTYDDTARGERVAAAAAELLRAADASQAGAERDGLTQVVASLPDGAVVLVREGERAIAAVTGKEPTVGLVLYDLRSCLRLAGETGARPKKRAARKPAAKKRDAEGAGDA